MQARVTCREGGPATIAGTDKAVRPRHFRQRHGSRRFSRMPRRTRCAIDLADESTRGAQSRSTRPGESANAPVAHLEEDETWT